jgi:hypothetical protein
VVFVSNAVTEFRIKQSSSSMENRQVAYVLRASRHLRVIGAAALLAAAVAGCGASGTESSASSSPAAVVSAGAAPSAQQSGAQEAGAQTAAEFTGVWQGTTLASCSVDLPLQSRCNAQQNVTITLLQEQDSKFSGKYQCSYGNMDCYHANETGKVIGVTMAGRRINIRVLMPDGTSCIFTGRNIHQTIDGGYTCYQGGARIEQGVWRSRRSY